MKLSIIIPFHEYPQYLIDCLQSIQDQQLDEYETILVSNRNDNQILQIVEDFKEAVHLTFIHSYDTALVATNRNIAIQVATGDYVYFLDSDDYLMPRCLSSLLSEANKKQLDVVCGLRRISWFKKTVFEGMGLEKNEEVNSTNRDSDKEDLVIDEEYGNTIEEKKRYSVDVLIRTRKGLKNVSVLHMLIKRSIIKEHAIFFDERFLYYTDLPFLIQVLANTTSFSRVKEAIYVKRKHNDPINTPALCQIVDTTRRFDEYITVYYYSATLVDKDSLIRHALDKKILGYYCKYFARKIRRSTEECWRQERYVMMALLLSNLHPSILQELKGYRKRLVKATIARDLKKTKAIIATNLAKQKIKKIIQNKNEMNKYLYRHKYINESLEDNFVVFESFRGQNYSDSPKYIYEYLAKNYPNKYTFIWVLNDSSIKLPYGGIKIKRFTKKYAYYLAKSKYLVFNVRQPLWFRKREGQILLQTWHGTPLKRLVFDQEEVTAATPSYKAQFFRQKQEWDYLIAANAFSSTVFRSCFMYDGEMLEVGYPRNDLLNAPNREELATRIKEKLQIPLDKKIILYAPTWRDDEYYGKGQYKFKLQLDLSLLKRELSDDYVILLRTHYYIADSLDVTGLEDFAFNVSKYNDITELYLISDICITDYSSVFFDYASLQRPILFFTYDLDKYRDVLRGFYIDMEKDLPGPLLFSSEEVVENIKNIEQLQIEYKDKYNQFYQRFCSLEDGNASKRSVEAVFK